MYSIFDALIAVLYMNPQFWLMMLCRRTRNYLGGLCGQVSSHFEYLQNRSCGLDETWQQVRGDLTAHS